MDWEEQSKITKSNEKQPYTTRLFYKKHKKGYTEIDKRKDTSAGNTCALVSPLKRR